MKNHSEKALRHIEEAMSLIPTNKAAAMLVRHAERPGMTKGHHGNELLLTPQGERDSYSAGKLMHGRICELLHSPVERCKQTAEKMQMGSGAAILPKMWIDLRCDAYVKDFNLALSTLGRLVQEDDFYDIFVKEMSESGLDVPYPHFHPPIIGASNLMCHLLSRTKAGMCVGVTHDWLINVAVSYAMGKTITRRYFTDYLDALFIWKTDGDYMFYHKGRHGKCADNFSKMLLQSFSN